MGHGWRCVTEAVRQKVVNSDKEKFTSNARNEAMFKEATEFAQHLKLLDKDLRALQKQVESNFSNLKFVLSSPLPRVYEETSSGVVAFDDDVKLIGHGVNLEGLSNSSDDLKKRLEEEVLLPLRQWVAAYQAIKDRMQKLEQVRLEVDSRKRTVEQLKERAEKARLALASTPAKSRAKAEVEVDKVVALLQHKDEKLARATCCFQELERTVYNSLYTLIKDTSVLREYAAVSIKIVQDGYHSAYRAFSLSTLPPEYQSTTGAGLGLNTGILTGAGAGAGAAAQFEDTAAIKANLQQAPSNQYAGMRDTDVNPDNGMYGTGAREGATGAGVRGAAAPAATANSAVGSCPAPKQYSNSGASVGNPQHDQDGNFAFRDDEYDVPAPIPGHRRNDSGSLPRAATAPGLQTPGGIGSGRYAVQDRDLGSPTKDTNNNHNATAAAGTAAAGGAPMVKLLRNNSEQMNGTGGRYRPTCSPAASPQPLMAYPAPVAYVGAGNYGGNYGGAPGPVVAGQTGGSPYSAAYADYGAGYVTHDSPTQPSKNPYAAMYENAVTHGY